MVGASTDSVDGGGLQETGGRSSMRIDMAQPEIASDETIADAIKAAWKSQHINNRYTDDSFAGALITDPVVGRALRVGFAYLGIKDPPRV